MENLYDKYYRELMAFNAEFCNFQCLTLDKIRSISSFKEFSDEDITGYIGLNKFLFYAETDKYVEFLNGKPYILSKFNIIFRVGVSKFTEDGDLDIDRCLFFSDFFEIPPSTIVISTSCSQKIYECIDNVKDRLWCESCLGPFNTVQSLMKIMHKKMNFTTMPSYSIIYIEKISSVADLNDFSSLLLIKKFLEDDKKKLDSIEDRINDLYKRMDKLIEGIKYDIEHHRIRLKNLLLSRGETMEEYLNTINEINSKIESLS